MPQPKPAQGRSESTWLERELGRSPTAQEVAQFDRLVGTTRDSRAALVQVDDGDLMRAAWRWEREHQNRGTVVFQLRARMNTLGAAEDRPEAPVDLGRAPRPSHIEGTITRPRGSTLTVPASDAQRVLATLADGLPALKALGVRSIVFELEED